MRFKCSILFSFLSFFFISQLFGQTVNARQLDEALASGNVTLVSANGTGSASGYSVNGRLRNNTQNEILINVLLNNGLYLSNSGNGQNMLALSILLEGLRYSTSGMTRYISLPANATTNIVFGAYCANREKDTPKTYETFTRTNMPASLQSLAVRLSNYYAINYINETGPSIQLALWRGQGETLVNIAGIYNFTLENWSASSNILGLPVIPPRPVASGTYSYSSSYTVTITADGFTMNWGGQTYRGVYIVVEDVLILKPVMGDSGLFAFTIVNNGLQDDEGDLWRRR